MEHESIIINTQGEEIFESTNTWCNLSGESTIIPLIQQTPTASYKNLDDKSKWVSIFGFGYYKLDIIFVFHYIWSAHQKFWVKHSENKRNIIFFTENVT
jgi:hypothetical protein